MSFIIRTGGSIKDALYFLADGKAGEPRWTLTQTAAHRFEDAEQARAKIRAIAEHAWADRMRPVLLVGKRTIRRTKEGST